MPVKQKRASDLLSISVGGSEMAIASAFSQAREEGAFLISDKPDSLFGNLDVSRFDAAPLKAFTATAEPH